MIRVRMEVNNKMLIEIVYIAFSVFYHGHTVNISEHAETKLQYDIFSGYNANARPSVNKDAINVRLDLALNHIVKLDESTQTITLSLYFNIKWKDGLLKWNPENYDGIKSTCVPTNKVWLPDIALFNAVKDAYDMGYQDTIVMIKSDGMVSFWGQKTKEVMCEIRTKKFPFDKHHCALSFSLVISDIEKVTLTPANRSIGLYWYKRVPEWDIVDNNVETDLTSDHSIDSELQYYSVVHYKISLQRNCNMCLLNILVPLLLLSLLNLLSFHVPVTSGEKLAFPVSIFLTVAVFLTVINGSLPEAVDGVSYLAIWVTVELAFCALTLLCTVINLRLYHYKTRSFFLFDKFASCIHSKPSYRNTQSNGQIKLDSSFPSTMDTRSEELIKERDTNTEEQYNDKNDVGKNSYGIWVDMETVCRKLDFIMLLLFFVGQIVTTVTILALLLR